MKKLLFTVLFLICCGSLSATAILDRSNDSLLINIYIPDTLANPVNDATGDSFFVSVISPYGVEVYSDSGLMTDGRILEIVWEDIGNDYWFHDVFTDLDGTSTTEGAYGYSMTVHDQSLGLQYRHSGLVQIVTSNFDLTLENMTDSLESISTALDAVRDTLEFLVTATGFSTLTELSNIGINWADITNQTTSVNLSNTTTNLTNTVTSITNRVGIDLDNTIGTFSKAEIPYLSYFDSLMYNGGRGMGIWIDGSAANINTVVGVDGTKKNPVSTLASARTIADALGATRYYFTQRSSMTLSATHEDWEFVGDGVDNNLALSSQDVDGSYFFNMVLSGAKGGTDDATAENCVISSVTDWDGFWYHCGIDGTNSIASSDDIFVFECFSMVAGNGTPTIDFGSGVCELNVRGYSGGWELTNMDGNDGASIEGHGQVIINANCTAPNVTVRGHFTLTDNDGGTTWTRDAVFSRQEVFGLQAQKVWDAPGPGDSAYGAATMGLDALNWDATGASAGIDSTVLSNVLRRIMFGIAVGSGTDSTTIAERQATWGYLPTGSYPTNFGLLTVDGSGNVTLALTDWTTDSDLIPIAKEASLFDNTTDQVIVSTNNDKTNYTLTVTPPTSAEIYTYFTSLSREDLFKATGFSTFDPTIDSIFLANIGQLSKEFADSVLYYDITGSFPNNSLAKFLRDFGLTIIRSEPSQGMSSGTSNHVILDAGASSIDGFYDPSRIVNTITGESTVILEYDGTSKVATLFRDLKTPFISGDDYIIFSDAGFLETNEGRVRGATLNTITLNPLASSVDNTYNNQTIFIPSGLGADQVAKISDYNGATKIATLYENFLTIPNDSSAYVIIPIGDGFETRFMDSLVANPIPVVALDTTTVGDTLATKKDSLIFQGGASSLTKEAIAEEVRVVAAANPGIFYGPLNAGSGLNPSTFFFIDTSAIPDDTVSGMGIASFNATGTPEASGNTDTDGAITFNMDAGNWLFAAGGNRAQYTADDTNFTLVNPFDTFAVLGYEVLVTAPSDPNLVRVYGKIRDIGGVVDPGGTIKVRISSGVKDLNGNIIGPWVREATADGVGYFEIDVIPSPLLIPSTTKIEFEIVRSDGSRIIRKSVVVPNSGTWELTW